MYESFEYNKENIENIISITSNYILLYAEDDEIVRETTSKTLKMFFKKVIIAKDGKEALELYNKEKVDIICSDIKMPNMNGIEFAKQVRIIDQYIPIIFFSGYDDLENRGEAVLIDAQFIRKPSYDNELICGFFVAAKQAEKNYQLIEEKKKAVVGNMVDSIAHQLMQPINSIFMGIGTLKLNLELGFTDDESIISALNRTEKQTKFLAETIDSFRSFYNKPGEKSNINLKSLIEETIFYIKDEILEKNIKLITDIDKNIEVYTTKEIIHIIINIVSNAKDALSEKDIENKKIKIKASEDSKQVYIDILDNAGGIAENILNKIFEDRCSTKLDKGGSGMGLWLANEIAKRDNIDIDIKNEKKGANFTIKINKEGF